MKYWVRNENLCWVRLDGGHMSSFVRFLQLWRAGNLFPIVFLHILLLDLFSQELHTFAPDIPPIVRHTSRCLPVSMFFFSPFVGSIFVSYFHFMHNFLKCHFSSFLHFHVNWLFSQIISFVIFVTFLPLL